jgi:hypothetical protein
MMAKPIFIPDPTPADIMEIVLTPLNTYEEYRGSLVDSYYLEENVANTDTWTPLQGD